MITKRYMHILIHIRFDNRSPYHAEDSSAIVIKIFREISDGKGTNPLHIYKMPPKMQSFSYTQTFHFRYCENTTLGDRVLLIRTVETQHICPVQRLSMIMALF